MTAEGNYLPGLTETATCTLVQQHWKPPPPSPDASFDCRRSTYSPGALKVAVAAVLPLLARSTLGFALSNVTGAGPRNIDQVAVTRFARPPAAPRPRAAVAPALAPRAGAAAAPSGAASVAGASPGATSSAFPTFNFAGSSLIQAVSASGSDAVAVNFAATPMGGPVNPAPSESNLITGGVFFDAGSSNGSTTHSLIVCSV